MQSVPYRADMCLTTYQAIEYSGDVKRANASGGATPFATSRRAADNPAMPAPAAPSAKRRFQFSLAGLLVFVLFLGSVGLVAKYWEPWYLERRVSVEDPSVAPYLLAWLDREWGRPVKAPDGVRSATTSYAEGDWRYSFESFGIIEYRSPCVVLWTYQESRISVEPVAFRDNDTLLAGEAPAVSAAYHAARSRVEWVLVFRRRHPEWWWGHFYRPEVWLCIVLGTLWLWRVARWLRSRRRTQTT